MNLVRKCALQEPLLPLSGEDSEWMEVDTGKMWQNVRGSSVFKDEDGKAYDIDGHIGVDVDGWTYTGGGNATLCYITFPYTKSRKYYPRLETLSEHGHIFELKDVLFETCDEVLALYESLGISKDQEQSLV